MHSPENSDAGDQRLTARQRTLLRGAEIFDLHIQNGLADKLAEAKRQREAARGRNTGDRHERFGAQAVAMLAVMCNLGEIIPHCNGLVVRKSRQEIANAITGSWKSTYPLIRQLEELGVIRVLRAGGPRPDHFELLIPAEPLEKKGGE